MGVIGCAEMAQLTDGSIFDHKLEETVNSAHFFTVILKKLQVSLAIMTDLWYLVSV